MTNEKTIAKAQKLQDQANEITAHVKSHLSSYTVQARTEALRSAALMRTQAQKLINSTFA